MKRSSVSSALTAASAEAEGEDSLKKMQLMELAILNGTYRDANIKSRKSLPAFLPGFVCTNRPASAQAPRIITGPAPVLPQAALRAPTPAGPAIMPLIRQIQTVMPNGSAHPAAATLVPPGPESAGLIYAAPYEYPYTLAPATSILEYPIDSSGVLGKHGCTCECPGGAQPPQPQAHQHPHAFGPWTAAPGLLLRHSS
ncbi:hypothetical protein P4O66_002116 [Electrophorus voltai]|uniref:Uncharacterized protein n=1 Tax=Electrophorus voltai TaxID=2609070 RepID=A0AAD8Z229_9TELE|nr:hypothetical protein P4O66_002116 [Electrophorus voltai]